MILNINPHACECESFLFQAQSRVLNGYYPCSEDSAIYLAGISMQVSEYIHTVKKINDCSFCFIFNFAD